MSFMGRLFNWKAKRYKDMILERLDIDENSIVADIGPGGGLLTKEFAKRAKKVYAVDVDRKLLEHVKKKTWRFDNVQTILVEESTELPGKMDLIFMRNVYHHLTDRVNYFRNLKQYLKGELVIIDWEKEKGHGTPRERIINELTEAGYKLDDEHIMPKQSFLKFIPAKVI
ncbi:MAG: class I SAM-dependent methyltransferase [Nanobdellota archaeon]